MQPDLRDPRPGDKVLIHAGALYDGSPLTEATVKEQLSPGFFILTGLTVGFLPEVILSKPYFNLDPNSLR